MKTTIRKTTLKKAVMMKTVRLAAVLAMAMACGAVARAQEARAITVSGMAPQVKDELFAGTEKFSKGASDVTELNLDPNMLGMVGNSKGADALAQKMDFVVIHSYTYDKPGMYNMADVEVYRKKLMDGSWNCFLHVTESKTGEATDICSRQSADKQTNEMVILAAEQKELTFIHMKGRMSLSDLQKESEKVGKLK